MNENPLPNYSAGFVAIVGLPNVGKSTLVNRLTGESLSIVTARPQTTRQRVTAIYSTETHQAIFVDTPGLLEPRYLLHESMQREAESGAVDADVLVYMVDVGYKRSLEHALAFNPPAGPKAVLCLNKQDRVDVQELAAIQSQFESANTWEVVVATTATQGKGSELLLDAILSRLPPGPALYPMDEVATAPVRFFVAEKIREVCFQELEEELPYSLAVGIGEYRENADPVFIEATIYIERESQKGIVIGKGGRTIKRIGIRSRQNIERFIGAKVYLDLRVKVLANWRKNPGKLKLLGYPVP
jgi:GTP-binding protein Era